QGVGIPRDVNPCLLDVRLEKPRADCALGAEFLDTIDRDMIDQARLFPIGNDGKVVARDDDPVPAQIAFERKVAGRRQKNRNAVELLAIEQLLYLTWDIFLNHCSAFGHSSSVERPGFRTEFGFARSKLANIVRAIVKSRRTIEEHVQHY